MNKQKGWRKCSGRFPNRRVSLDFLVLDLIKDLASAKQQRNAPNTGKSYNGVDDAAQQRGLSAADPRYNIKLKQSDAAPVERANDGQNQRNAIQYHHFVSFAYCGIRLRKMRDSFEIPTACSMRQCCFVMRAAFKKEILCKKTHICWQTMAIKI